MPWEASTSDWNYEGIDGKEVTPDQVLSLISSKTEEEANTKYWKLDGVVCANGVAYGASLSVVKLILAMLPTCSNAAKRSCLELLGQISVCEAHVNSPEVVSACLKELKLSSWLFLHGLQFDTPENAWLYVDLIGVLGEKYSDFRPKAKFYLNQVLNRKLPVDDFEMVQNTLKELN